MVGRPAGGLRCRAACCVILLLAGCAAAAAYQLLALFACVRHWLHKPSITLFTPPVSILKPIYGADEGFYRAIESHARLDYPYFEILFGVSNSNDTALPHIRRLQAEFPRVPIRIVERETQAPNGKVGALVDLAQAAAHPFLLVNDSDIYVQPDYLRRVVAPLQRPEIGLVTCLYRAAALSFPSRLEALGIATDFAPSALLAPLLGVNEFGLGSTLCFRRSDLERLGGFNSIASYIADDYQLGKSISQLGLRVHLSDVSVETHLGAGSWKSVWDHQVRWARTIRSCRGVGYAGLFLANGTVWSLLALSGGLYLPAVSLIILRLAVGLTCGIGVLRDPLTVRLWWLMPVRDIFGFAVWVAGLAGRRVIWRGTRMRLDRHGRIEQS